MEVLRKLAKQDNKANIGGRALVLCANCPFAAKCAVAPVEECEYGGDGGGGAPPMPERAPEKQRTYRELLLDDRVPVVMVGEGVTDTYVNRKPVHVPPKAPPKVVSKPKPVKKTAPKPPVRPAFAERAGEAIADIFASLIGVHGVAKAVKRRRA